MGREDIEGFRRFNYNHSPAIDGLLHKRQQITNLFNLDFGILFFIVFVGADMHIIGMRISLEPLATATFATCTRRLPTQTQDPSQKPLAKCLLATALFARKQDTMRKLGKTSSQRFPNLLLPWINRCIDIKRHVFNSS